MAISPISPASISSFAGLDRLGTTLPTSPVAPTTTRGVETGDGSFADSLMNALDKVSDSHRTADALALEAATGDLNAVHDYTIAATEAQLMTQLTVEIRNRAVDAFNDIMRMQV